MIQDKIFFDEKDPTGISYNTPFTVYGSYQGRLWSKTPTGSIKYYTQNSDLSVYATTGSNQFSGSQTVTGSLTVTGGITGSVTTASYVEYTGVANKPALVSSSAQIVGYNVFATTGSNQFNGSQAVTGSLTVTGQVVAQTLNVQQVTSSIVYSSGSNIFGNTLGNTQQFTGSVSVTGSLAVAGALSGTSGTFSSNFEIGNTAGAAINNASGLGNLVVGNGGASSQGITIYTNSSTYGGLNFADATTGGGAYAGYIKFDHTNDSMGLFIGNTPRLTIASTGVATFSTNSNSIISNTFQNTDTTNASTRNYFNIIAGTNRISLYSLHSDNNYINTAYGDLYFQMNASTSTTNAMIIKAGGNVGIGTTSPLQTASNRTVTTINGTSSAILNLATGDTLRGYVYVDSSGTTLESIGTLSIGTNTSSALVAYTGGTERLRITPEGYLGTTVTGDTITSGDLLGVLSFVSRDASTYSSGGITNIRSYATSTYNTGNVSGDLRFYVSNGLQNTTASYLFGTEAMRITSEGYLKVSNTGAYLSSGEPYHEFSNNRVNYPALLVWANSGDFGDQAFSIYTNRNTTNNTYYAISYYNVPAAAYKFRVADSGNVTNTNNSYGAISDIKLKENIVDATSKLDDLLKVKVKNFNFIGSEEKQIGVIAQELEEIFPGLVSESEDFEEVEITDEEGNITKEKQSLGTTTKSVKYSIFVPMLIKAMQEQQTQIESLKSENDTLKSILQRNNIS